MRTTRHSSPDVIVIGAGLAGATAAVLLARQGIRTVLVDRWSAFPACFKAEKIEPDQADLLRKFDLLSPLLPRTGRIREILVAQDGRVQETQPLEQFGIFYQDLVNGIRRTLPPEVGFQIGQVRDIETTDGLQRVRLSDGGEWSAPLVVLTSGTGGDLPTRLGMWKRMIQKDQSLAFGFTIARPDRQPFGFDAVTYYPDDIGERVAYLTLFRIGQKMRGNFFVFWSASEDRTRRFVREPRRELLRLLPKLADVTGEFDVVDRVETGRIDLYRMEDQVRPGVVLLGDAFLSVCPTTGLGLTKVLTDVDVFCHQYLPQWLSTPGMGVEKIAQFYRCPRKNKVDDESIRNARYNREIAINGGWAWRAQRIRRRWQTQLRAWPRVFACAGGETG